MLIVNVLHVLGAVFVVGPLVVLPMVGLFAVKHHHVAMVAHLARLTTVLNFSSLAVVALGFGLVSLGDADEGWSMTTPWIVASAVLYLLAFVGMATIVIPQLRRAGIQAEQRATAETPKSALLAASSGVVSILLVCVVVLMVAQPGG